MRTLLEGGVSINCQDPLVEGEQSEYLHTPLTIAAVRGHLEAVTLLIEKGAEINRQIR